MAIGFAPETASVNASRRAGRHRTLEPAEWTAAGIPLLINPREVVTDLHTRHLPAPGTAVVAVYSPDERLTASASFAQRPHVVDGWERRNAILVHLRRITADDLRRRRPVRTAVLLVCRDGGAGWTEVDGAWMWGLRDACSLYGLRPGSYITVTDDGWRVQGEDRTGRTPNATSWSAAASRGAASLRPSGTPPLRRAAAR
ncbi:hypothetical protein [Actinacidiphila glaucinigra]|uniref:Uncharacterized protein n=1 Tax=Actinacidiphila glaucinigra TaxID=235986 RepID=A0A239C954_9ACTN|nr:hypothetical protein [Actinacidiphila glaucinigra]SNS16765.1 hypothetical protein SAMN05216252_103439 [Actinacidiphila glaucinigra]